MKALFIAYGLVWIALFGYLLRLSIGLKRVRREIRLLKKQLQQEAGKAEEPASQ